MTVGERIKEARAARNGMSRPELARLSGVPYPTLAGLENGDQHGSTALPAIATALGVSAVWLQTGKGPRDAEPLRSVPSDGPLARRESQFPRPDPDILHEALTLLAFSEEQAGAYLDRPRTNELLRLYDLVVAEGGRLSPESNDAFEASVWARKNRLGGSDDRSKKPRHRASKE